MFRWSRPVAWLLTALIIVISVIPAPVRPTTSAGHNFEHLLIFAVTGVAFGIGYFRQPYWLILGLPLFAGLVELVQIAVPSRHARLMDFVMDSVAVLLGAVIVLIVLRLKFR